MTLHCARCGTHIAAVLDGNSASVAPSSPDRVESPVMSSVRRHLPPTARGVGPNPLPGLRSCRSWLPKEHGYSCRTDDGRSGHRIDLFGSCSSAVKEVINFMLLGILFRGYTRRLGSLEPAAPQRSTDGGRERRSRTRRLWGIARSRGAANEWRKAACAG